MERLACGLYSIFIRFQTPKLHKRASLSTNENMLAAIFLEKKLCFILIMHRFRSTPTTMKVC